MFQTAARLGMGVVSDRAQGFRDSGFGIRDSGFGYQDFGDRDDSDDVTLYGVQNRDSHERRPSLEITLSSSLPSPEILASGSRSRIGGFGFRIPGWGILASGFGSRVQGAGCRV